MNTTYLVAGLYGPVVLLVGLSVLMHRDFYVKMLGEYVKSSALMYFGGMTAFTVGLLIVTHHSYWDTPAEIIVSLVGWGALLKGAMFLLAPQMAVDITSSWKDRAQTAGIICIVLGGYLSWFAYM